MARLIIHSGPLRGMSYAVAGTRVCIGRDPGCDVPLSDPQASRQHAEIRTEADGYHIMDLGSRNGTHVDGRQVKERMLADGDRLRIGDTVLVFELERPAVRPGEETREALSAARRETLSREDVRITATEPAADEDLRQARRDLVVLHELARLLGQAQTRGQVAQALQEALRDPLEADRTLLVLKSDHDYEPVGSGEQTLAGALTTTPLSSTVLKQADTEARSVLVASAQHPRYQAAPSIQQAGIHTAMAAPLLRENTIAGFLYADRLGGGDPFTRRDLELLTAAAVHVAVTLERVRQATRLQEHHRRLVEELQPERAIVGRSEPIRQVLEFIRRAAPTDAGVLVLGESGTGKELVARALHEQSRRAAEAFEIVNCAALSDSLVESELFGHAKGAFTGAAAERAGRFELADKGTIFLDEIGELTEAAQSKILRVLEQGEIVRVGEGRVRHVDVRVVAATNRDLLQEVKDGRFREDLFYRLNVLSVTLPPLRQRRDDIPLLLRHFLALQRRRCGRPQLALSPDAEAALAAYDWPGNVRELRNVVERLAIMSPQETIERDDLPTDLRRDAPSHVINAQSLAEVEKAHILKTLRHAGGNKKYAAELLGIDRSTLYAKLKQYELQP